MRLHRPDYLQRLTQTRPPYNRPRRRCSPLIMSSVCATKLRQRRRYCHDWLTALRLYLLAHHYARLGEHAKALSLLKQCAALNEEFDPARVKAFAPLESDREFRDLVERARRQNPPVHRARVAFTVAQTDLFPEGLAADAPKRVFYMGSEYHNKIVTISEAGEVTDFVKEGTFDLMPVGGVHVDPMDHSVWCATDPGAKNRSEIVHFDAQGKLLERYTPTTPGPHALNDFVLRSTNEIYVTDAEGNRVFRFDRESHRFTELNLGRPVFGPQRYHCF